MDRWDLKRKLLMGKELLIRACYPLTCPVCGKKLPLGIVVHEACRKQLPVITEPYCLRCGKQLESETEEYCYDCLAHKHYYKQGVAAFAYDRCIRQAIYDLKYKNKRENAAFFAKFMAEAMEKRRLFWKAEILVPVPIYNKKKKLRGYNQAELLADAIALEGGYEVRKDLIYRIRETKPQKEMSNQERRENLKNAFAVDAEKCAAVPRVILIDDIYTTGSTADHCAKLLRAAGVQEVYYAAIAIGSGL